MVKADALAIVVHILALLPALYIEINCGITIWKVVTLIDQEVAAMGDIHPEVCTEVRVLVVTPVFAKHERVDAVRGQPGSYAKPDRACEAHRNRVQIVKAMEYTLPV
jgi:hypothetical protein